MPPWGLILIGFVLSMLGVVLPYLMLVQALPSTFFLNFFSFTSSTAGLILGIIGASLYFRTHRRK